MASSERLRVWTHTVDLGDLDALAPRLDDVFEAVSASTYDKAVLFNNAGLVGPIAYAQARLHRR